MGSERQWQPRFTITSLLLLMTVASVMSAAGYYLVQGMQSGWVIQLRFLVFVVAAPLLSMVVLSILVSLFRRPRRRK